MTPQEKAKELVNNFDNTLTYLESKTKVKDCILIMVNELINCTPSIDMYPPNFQTIHPRVREFWKQVKQEIEKM